MLRRPRDYYHLVRAFLRASIPAAAADEAGRVRKRIPPQEPPILLGLAAASSGDGSSVSVGGSGGGGGGGGSHGGWYYGVPDELSSEARNNNFTDEFNSGSFEPWWSLWKGTTPTMTGGVLKWNTQGTGSIGNIGAYNAASFADVIASTVIVTGTTNGMVFARGVVGLGELSGYAARAGATLRLYRVDAGVPTQLASDGLSGFASGDTLGIECSGTTIKLLKNGLVLLSVVDATYASGSAGLAKWAAVGTTTFDSFTVAG